MKNLGKIKLLPAREQVASVLRKAILTKELEEGQEITLEGIAKQVGVSSMPVREAFQILAQDGLIKLRPNKGAVVLGLNEKSIRDHYETRALLESEACRLASLKGKDITEIESAYNTIDESLKDNDWSSYSQQNQGFHMAIWSVAGNAKIKSILSSMWNGLSIGRKVTEEEYAKTSSREHFEILEAIKEHNSEKAKNLMYRHIIRSMEDILTRFENN